MSQPEPFVVVEVDGPGPNILCPNQATADAVLDLVRNNGRLLREEAARAAARSTGDGGQPA
jgi:hypothetical protein